MDSVWGSYGRTPGNSKREEYHRAHPWWGGSLNVALKEEFLIEMISWGCILNVSSESGGLTSARCHLYNSVACACTPAH